MKKSTLCITLLILIFLALNSNAAIIQTVATGNWNARLTWAAVKTGTVTTTLTSQTVTGVNTLFTQEFIVGDKVFDNPTETNPLVEVGTVLSIQSNTSMTLQVNALSAIGGMTFRGSGTPSISDDVLIGVHNGTTALTLTSNVNGTCNTVKFLKGLDAGNFTLSISSGITLNVISTISVQQPNGSATNQISVSGILNSGSITLIGNKIGQNTQVASLNINDLGVANVNGNINMQDDINSKVIATGTGRPNITGNFNSANVYPSVVTLNFAANSILNFNSSVSTQALITSITTAKYGNVYFNNGSDNGATINGAITATNVTGDIRIQSGRFTTQGSINMSSGIPNLNGAGLGITGNITKTLAVSNGAMMRVYTTFPTGFGTFSLEPTSTVEYNGTVTYNALLTLTSGIITTGSFNVIAPSVATVSRTSGHVFGNLKKHIVTGTNVARTFQVGTATVYTPMDIVFASVTTAGFVTGKSTGGDHPSINNSSCLMSSKSVNAYYTLTNNTATITTFGITFNYPSSLIDAAATPSGFQVKSYSGTAWSGTLTISGTPSTASTTVSGVSVFGEYQIAETGLAFNPQPTSVIACEGASASFTGISNG